MKYFSFYKFSTLLCIIFLNITPAPLSRAADSEPSPPPPSTDSAPSPPGKNPPQQKTSEIPPEILRQLLQNHTNSPFPTNSPYPAAPQHLSTIGRILLVLLAGIVLLLGIIFCRFLSMKNYFNHSDDLLFLIFGMFGSQAAILIAAAATASLHLHIAAVCCTVVSGFMICSLGLAQFSRAHKLIIVNTDQTAKNSERNQFKKQDRDHGTSE
ncbi:MAG: hypothetical protein JXD22_17060 [Sedimentisphaerales bacterium]|nr:hypothetical protein [Sedimentisphaerales bacterium]